ncbi:MAG: response regulator [Tenuifilaceae bacterium]
MESLNNITVLYVDDEPINLELFKMSFRRVFNVIVAESGPQGLEVLQNTNGITAVISDMKMPNMSGLEFIQKAVTYNSKISYFLLSGYSISQEVEESIENGLIKKYFQKPFSKTEIIDSIQNCL